MRLLHTGMLVACAVSLLAVGGCGQDKTAKPAAQASKEPAAATVNGTPISQRAFDAMLKEATGAGRPDSPETRKVVVDQLALQLLASEEAVKKGLDKTPEVAEQLDAIRQSVLANAYVQDYVKSHPVTDEALKAEYERLKGATSASEYKARHILVATEAEAKGVIASLRKNPAGFAGLAKSKSKDPGSSGAGGDLGWFDARRMVPEFGAAVGKLEKGKFTEEPVKTQYGYHVILLEDTRPVQAPPLDDIKPMLSRQMQQQSLIKHLDELKSKAKIEIAAAAASAPPASAAPAGAPPASAGTSAPPASPAPGAAPPSAPKK